MARKTIKFERNPLFSGPTIEARSKLGSPYRELNISDIDVDPDQPRRVFEPESLADLSASIKKHGVICPILVRVLEGGTFRLVAGERRLRAAKLAGLETIPAVVDTTDEKDDDTLAKQLVENLQRQDLTPMERALAIGQLRDRHELSVRDIAAQLGISKTMVQRSLDVLGLPEDLQAALIAGAAESKILLLGQVKSREIRKALLQRLDSLSRNDLEAEIRGDGAKTSEMSHRGTAKRNDGVVSEPSVEDRRIIEEIQKTLGTKVDLVRKPGAPEHGKLSLEFYSASDLYEIYRRLTA